MKVLLKVAQGTGNVELGRVPTLKAGPDRVLIRVHACGILGSDLKMEADEHPGVTHHAHPALGQWKRGL